MLKYVAVFFGVAAVDYGWSRYIAAVSRKRAGLAAVYSLGIYLVGTVNLLLTVEDHWVIIPAAIGTVAGTYLAVKHESSQS